MKALIATGLGVLALGGLLVANSGRSASALTQPATVVNQTEASRTTLVNCGEGRQAVIYTDARTGPSQVQCVGEMAGVVPGMIPGVSAAMPVSQFAPAIVPAGSVHPAVQERVVYADRPVSSSSRTSSVRRTSLPASSRGSEVSTAPQTRSWKKSALIIGGSTAGGAAVGAILDGKKGAVKGGVVGLLGGTIYDIATRTKH